jgi:hypothetical protein
MRWTRPVQTTEPKLSLFGMGKLWELNSQETTDAIFRIQISQAVTASLCEGSVQSLSFAGLMKPVFHFQ